jgi:hypothetical protein
MKTIKVKSYREIPGGYTGIVEWPMIRGWFLNGEKHRLEGPAIEGLDVSHTPKEWWVYGKLHRLDGPAIEWSDNGKSWWVDGIPVNEEDYPSAVLLYKCKRVLES